MDIQILECRRFSATYSPKKSLRTVKDYEIDLELGETRIIGIDGIEHEIKRGDVCVRAPGQTVYGKSPPDSELVRQSSILVTVDFSGREQEPSYSRNVDGPIQPRSRWELLEKLNGVITPHSEYTFIPLYTELLRVAFTDKIAARTLITELLYRLGAEVCRREYSPRRAPETPCSLALTFMQENLDQNISLDALARQVHLDKNYFVRIFKKTYGQTPIQALITMRMERAGDLLANTQMNISDIAAACGYGSSSHFIAEYKKHYGQTPLRQRRSSR